VRLQREDPPHYSTVQPLEQRESIGKVLRLVAGAGVTSPAARSGAPTGAPRAKVVRRGEVEGD
jgi:hypothetical protein